MTDTKLHRREFLKLGGSAAALAALSTFMPRVARADELPHLSEADPTAAALGYRDDASKVDAAKYPTHKAGQACAKCKFFQGTDKTPWAGCQLFPGKAVAVKGWCSGYSAKA